MVALNHLTKQILRTRLFVSIKFPKALGDQALIIKHPSLVIKQGIRMMAVMPFHSLSQ